MMVSIRPVTTAVEFLSTIFPDLVPFIRHIVQLELMKVYKGFIAVSSIHTLSGGFQIYMYTDSQEQIGVSRQTHQSRDRNLCKRYSSVSTSKDRFDCTLQTRLFVDITPIFTITHSSVPRVLILSCLFW